MEWYYKEIPKRVKRFAVIASDTYIFDTLLDAQRCAEQLEAEGKDKEIIVCELRTLDIRKRVEK